MNKKLKKQHQRTPVLSWLVFLATLAVVLISLTSLIFPALLIRSTSSFENYSNVNPFDVGPSATPLVATNFVFLVLGILYKKNRLPVSVTKPIRFIFNFEISKKVTLGVIVILLGIYISLSANELSTEEHWDDYQKVKPRLEKWTINDITKSFEPHVSYFLVSASMKVFGNYMVIPFIGSIALLILTYFITYEISKKRFAGIISLVIVLQSGIFLIFDTSVTYTNFWILLYVFSLYLIYKKWPLSLVFYVMSIASKALTTIYFPMTLFFIYRSGITKKEKKLLALLYIAVGAILVVLLVYSPKLLVGTSLGFDPNDFWMGFTAFSLGFRFDALVSVFLLPLVVALFIVSRKGITEADSIMILIMGILLAAPFLGGFTNQTNQLYRFIPLTVFFAIGVGTILSKKVNAQT